MKHTTLYLLAVALFPLAASADTVSHRLAPVLTEVWIKRVGSKGVVLKKTVSPPCTEFLIAVPVVVEIENDCLTFAGQTLSVEGGEYQVIRMLGGSDPLTPGCGQAGPLLIKTNLTYTMDVITEGLPVERIQRRNIVITPLGFFELALDLHDKNVTVRWLGKTL